MAVRERYLEILGREAALSAAKGRDFGKIELVKENSSVRLEHVKVHDKKIEEKIRQLNQEEKEFLKKIFDKEFENILCKGVHKLTRKEQVNAGVPTKWS